MQFCLPYFAKEGPHLKRKNQAENSSAQSDLVIEISFNVRTAWEALRLLYLCTHFEVWETDRLIRSIAHKAYAFSYEGKWQVVQRFLEVQIDTPQQFENLFTEISGLSMNEFTNILKDFSKVERLVKYKDLTTKSTKRVKYPQRKRGYADKGSYRFPHERHGDPPVKQEHEDRRVYVHFNPLAVINTTGGDSCTDPHPGKEECS